MLHVHSRTPSRATLHRLEKDSRHDPKRVSLLRGALILVPAISLASPADSPAESPNVLVEVVVTAQKREQNLQDVPIAISALTSAELEAKGITSLDGVAAATPSVTFTPYPSSSNTLILFMRGQGLDNPGVLRDSAVGLYEDGFYLSRANAMTFDLADMERVEVLRGPQGTLYGRNTTGGAVNLISKKPTGEFGFKQSLDFGSRQMLRSLTTIDLPRWGDLSAKATFLKSSIDGYVENIGSSHDYGEEEQTGARVQLRWEAASNVTADYFFEKGEVESTPIYFQNPSQNGLDLVNFDGTGPIYQVSVDKPDRKTYRAFDLPLSQSDFEMHGLTVEWDVNDALTIKSLTGYRELDSDAQQDYAEAFGFPLTTQNIVQQHQFSQEIQFLGSVLDDRIKYIAGLYYFDESASDHTTNNYGKNDLTTGESKSRAMFAQVVWTPQILNDALDLTVGARYTEDDRSAEFLGSSLGDLSYQKFNPSFTVSYRWTDDINSYASVSTAYKAGSFLATDVGASQWRPEELTNYEVGLKSYLFDHQVQLNLAAFHSDYQDIQYLLPLPPPTFNGTAQNIGSATIQGVELDLTLMPIRNLTLRLNGSYLHWNVDEFAVQPNTVFDSSAGSGSPYVVGQNINGVGAILYAPKYSFNVDADYTLLEFASGDLSAYLNYRWTDRFYGDPVAGEDTPGRDFSSWSPYGVLDGRITMTMALAHGGQAKVSLWGKNLAQREYAAFILANGPGISEFANGAPVGYASQSVAWAAPRSYGIQLQYEFE